MILCKNCRHVERESILLPVKRYAMCMHPQATEVQSAHVVTGEVLQVRKACSVMRLNHQPCGEEAKLFEAEK